jgi:hypothetical protein
MTNSEGTPSKAVAALWQFEIVTDGSSKPTLKTVTAPTEKDAKQIAKLMGWNWLSLTKMGKSAKSNQAKTKKSKQQESGTKESNMPLARRTRKGDSPEIVTSVARETGRITGRISPDAPCQPPVRS